MRAWYRQTSEQVADASAGPSISLLDPLTTRSWRETPVLEAVLRLTRRNELVTPENIAAEAVLHFDDVCDGVAELIRAGYLDILEIVTDERTTILSISTAFATLVRSPLTRSGRIR